MMSASRAPGRVMCRRSARDACLAPHDAERQMLNTSRVAGLALAFTVAGCGGEPAAPNAPTPIYPAVSGNYQILGDFNGIPSNIGWLDGTFSVQQPTRTEPGLAGNARIDVHIDGELFEFYYPLSAASVTADGALTFVLRESAQDAWTFTAQVSGGLMTGNHTLIAGGTSGALTGGFSATRTGGSGRSASLAVGAVPGSAPTLGELLNRMRVR
jgi:hypothetical protein